MSKKQKPTIEPDALPSDHEDNLAEVPEGLSVMATLSAPVVPDVDAELDAMVVKIDRRSTARGTMLAERQAEAATVTAWPAYSFYKEAEGAEADYAACKESARAANEALRKAQVRLDNAKTSLANARAAEKGK